MLGKSDSAKREAEAEEQQRRQLATAELASLHPWAGHDLVQVGLSTAQATVQQPWRPIHQSRNNVVQRFGMWVFRTRDSAFTCPVPSRRQCWRGWAASDRRLPRCWTRCWPLCWRSSGAAATAANGAAATTARRHRQQTMRQMLHCETPLEATPLQGQRGQLSRRMITSWLQTLRRSPIGRLLHFKSETSPFGAKWARHNIGRHTNNENSINSIACSHMTLPQVLRASTEALLYVSCCRQHRGEAIRLTHAWQRGMHQAAAAFAAGDKAAASRIAQSARRKRLVFDEQAFVMLV